MVPSVSEVVFGADGDNVTDGGRADDKGRACGIVGEVKRPDEPEKGKREEVDDAIGDEELLVFQSERRFIAIAFRSPRLSLGKIARRCLIPIKNSDKSTRQRPCSNPGIYLYEGWASDLFAMISIFICT